MENLVISLADKTRICNIRNLKFGRDEMRSGYVRYIQGNHPNLPSGRQGLYNSMNFDLERT